MAESSREVRATIVVPSFDHAAWVEEAVSSALAQTERDVEVIVIDDGSTDDSVARLARMSDPRLEVVTQANAGLSNTLNRGLARARGRWVRFLPSDDALEPDCLARQLAAADAAPGARLVFALPTVVDAHGAPYPDPAPQAWFDHAPEGRDEILRDLLERNFLCAPGVLFDRDLARVVGGFDPALRIAQDYDLWLRMLPWAPAVFVRERLVRVRWHGANQSGVVTPESEGERARVVRGALARFGLARWVELFRARAADGSLAGASAALADALTGSGLHALAPLAARLRAVRDEDDGSVRRFVRSLGRVLRRSAVPRPPTAATVQVLAATCRPERWIVVAARAETGPRARLLAGALAAEGLAVTLAAVTSAVDTPAPGPGVKLVPCDLATLRTLAGTRDERVRLVVQEPDAGVIAFAREVRLAGVRVLYDRADGPTAVTRAAIDSERALIDAADDLVAGSRATLRQLAVGRRLAHLLPDAAPGTPAVERARALRGIAARPTVVVAVSCSSAHRAADVDACLERLEAARGNVAYRVVVVDDGVDGELLDALASRDEAGELQLVRNALRGRASGLNLALRATASELLVLVDATRLAPGPGWLDAPLSTLLGDARTGAVVERGRGGGSGWAWLVSRRLLQHLGGFDEQQDPSGLEDADQERQLEAAGYRVVEWSALAPAPVPSSRHGVGDVVAARRAVQRFAHRWPDAPLPRDWARIAGEV